MVYSFLEKCEKELHPASFVLKNRDLSFFFAFFAAAVRFFPPLLKTLRAIFIAV